MRIIWTGFCARNHSWSVVAQNICRQLIKLGNDVHIFSTNGTEHFPDDLMPYLKLSVEENQIQDLNDLNKYADKFLYKEYDLALSYTSLKNFPYYLWRGKRKLGIWCYEWAGKNVIPKGWAKNYKYCNYILAPSVFTKKIFTDAGIPDSAVEVIPHGIDVEQYKQTTMIQLPTTKKYKILSNIAQNHLRKNITGLLEAYGRAFTKEDDVCLILKAKEKPIKQPFDVSLNACIKQFHHQFPNAAEVKVISEFIDDISALYRSCDSFFTATHCEGFLFPALEAIASGKIPIVPRWGGQIDFLNDDNALLIDGKEVKANPKSMYWEPNNNAVWFQPNMQDMVDKLRYSYEHYEELNKKVESMRQDVFDNYDWSVIAKNIIELCDVK